jgi:hypothetical protein
LKVDVGSPANPRTGQTGWRLPKDTKHPLDRYKQQEIQGGILPAVPLAKCRPVFGPACDWGVAFDPAPPGLGICARGSFQDLKRTGASIRNGPGSKFRDLFQSAMRAAVMDIETGTAEQPGGSRCFPVAIRLTGISRKLTICVVFSR